MAGVGLYESLQGYNFKSAEAFREFLNSHPNISYQDALSVWQENLPNLLGNKIEAEKMYRIMNDHFAGIRDSIYEGLNDGSISGSDALNTGSRTGLTQLPDVSDVIENQLSDDKATTAYDREIAARDTSLLSQANQLDQLGLNVGSVLSIGGAQTPQVGQAYSSQLNNASMAQQKLINNYNQKQAMSRQLIGMVSSLGRAAIGGTAYGLARSAAAKAVQSTAGAAKEVLLDREPYRDSKISPKAWAKLMSQL